MKAFVPKMLAVLPESWLGTTFRNSALLTRSGFYERLAALVVAKEKEGAAYTVTNAELVAIGNAEDYFRVASNISTVLEISLGLDRGLHVDKVFTFASTAMPFVAAALAMDTTAHVYHGAAKSPFDDKQLAMLKLIGAVVVPHAGAPAAHADGIVLQAVDPDAPVTALPAGVDGVVAGGVLFIHTEKIDPAQVSCLFL
jgi:hypothetical protein